MVACVVLDLAISVSLGLLYFVVVSSGFDSVFAVLTKRLARKSVSRMTYFLSSGTLNFNLVNQCLLSCLRYHTADSPKLLYRFL